MEKQETLGKRLRQIMEERGLNYEAFGKLLDMRPQTLNRYVLDQRAPKAQIVTEMALRLEVDALWLQGYDVPRERPKDPTQERGSQMVPVLAVIHGKTPAWEDQKIVDYAAADVQEEGGYCYLRVSEDGMRGAGIYPGDLVLVRKQESAKTGQIVVCTVGREDAKLQRYCQQGDLVILQSECVASPPRILPMEAFLNGAAHIFGVAVRLVRNL